MSKTKMLIGTGILIAVGLAVHFTVNQKDKAGDKFVEFISSEGLEKISIKRSDKTLELNLDPNLERWMVKGKNVPQVIADANKIVRLLDNLNEAKVLQKVTEKSKHYDKFEVSESKASILETKTNNNKDATFYFGKTKDYSSQFVRRKGDPSVYLISKNINLGTDADSWFHKKLKIGKDELKSIKYKTKDRKNVELSYNLTKDSFALSGSPPPKKQLKKLPNLAEQFTEISFNNVKPKKDIKKTKAVAEHKLTLGDKTQLNYKFLESKDKPQKYYLDLDIKKGAAKLSPRMSYLASLSNKYSFELSSINSYVFQKKSDDFFEEIKEEKKEEASKESVKK